MKKKYLKLLIFSLLLLIVTSLVIYAFYIKKENILNKIYSSFTKEKNTEQVMEGIIRENEDFTYDITKAVNIDKDGVDVREKASLEAQSRELPYPDLEGLGLEFMNEEEKNEFNIPPFFEAQIIARDFSGEITAYRVVYEVGDIIYPN